MTSLLCCITAHFSFEFCLPFIKFTSISIFVEGWLGSGLTLVGTEMLWAVSLLDMNCDMELYSMASLSHVSSCNTGICGNDSRYSRTVLFFFFIIPWCISVLKRNLNIWFFPMKPGNCKLIFLLKQRDSYFPWKISVKHLRSSAKCCKKRFQCLSTVKVLKKKV